MMYMFTDRQLQWEKQSMPLKRLMQFLRMKCLQNGQEEVMICCRGTAVHFQDRSASVSQGTPYLIGWIGFH